MENAILDSVELPAGERAQLSLPLPAAYVVVFEPVIHAAQFLDVSGEPTSERQNVSVVYNNVRDPSEPIRRRPGTLHLLLEYRTNFRLLPTVWVMGTAVHNLLDRRKPFLTGKRLLSNPTFRDLYGTETLDVAQQLHITTLTIFLTDPTSSTSLH